MQAFFHLFCLDNLIKRLYNRLVVGEMEETNPVQVPRLLVGKKKGGRSPRKASIAEAVTDVC